METDFEEETQAEEATEQPKPKAADENGIPYCEDHHVRMVPASGGGRGAKVAFYKCPVKGCECRAKRIKTRRESSIPKDPMVCRTCGKGKEVMVRNKRMSTATYTVLECPKCGRKSAPMPRPEYVNVATRRSQPRIADVGDR